MLGFTYTYTTSDLIYYNCYHKGKQLNKFPLTKKEKSSLKFIVKKKLDLNIICKDDVLISLSEFYSLRN
jgi:hypothetical protein